jgi:hypothetical protein
MELFMELSDPDWPFEASLIGRIASEIAIELAMRDGE